MTRSSLVRRLRRVPELGGPVWTNAMGRFPESSLTEIAQPGMAGFECGSNVAPSGCGLSGHRSRSFCRDAAVRLPYEPINDAGWLSLSLSLCCCQCGTECRSARPAESPPSSRSGLCDFPPPNSAQNRWPLTESREPFMLGDKNLLMASANGDRTPNLILRSALAS